LCEDCLRAKTSALFSVIRSCPFAQVVVGVANPGFEYP
jgi:hypothetical protein